MDTLLISEELCIYITSYSRGRFFQRGPVKGGKQPKLQAGIRPTGLVIYIITSGFCSPERRRRTACVCVSKGLLQPKKDFNLQRSVQIEILALRRNHPLIHTPTTTIHIYKENPPSMTAFVPVTDWDSANNFTCRATSFIRIYVRNCEPGIIE
jgi:hypothetical protein